MYPHHNDCGGGGCAACNYESSGRAQCDEAHVEPQYLALKLEYDRLALAADGFCHSVDDAVAHANRPQGGQQVSFHGDFANAGPSVLMRLQWHVRNIRGGKDNLEYAISFMEKQERDLRARILELEIKLEEYKLGKR